MVMPNMLALSAMRRARGLVVASVGAVCACDEVGRADSVREPEPQTTIASRGADMPTHVVDVTAPPLSRPTSLEERPLCPARVGPEDVVRDLPSRLGTSFRTTLRIEHWTSPADAIAVGGSQHFAILMSGASAWTGAKERTFSLMGTTRAFVAGGPVDVPQLVLVEGDVCGERREPIGTAVAGTSTPRRTAAGATK